VQQPALLLAFGDLMVAWLLARQAIYRRPPVRALQTTAAHRADRDVSRHARPGRGAPRFSFHQLTRASISPLAG